MALSEYTRSKLLNWIKGTAFGAAPANVYISLHSSDPGLTGAGEISATATGYARKVIAPSGWNAPSDSGIDKVMDQVATVDFGPATNSVGWDVNFFGVWDATTAGNFLWGGVTTSRQVAQNDHYIFDPGDLNLFVR